MKTSAAVVLIAALVGGFIVAALAEAKPGGCVTYHRRSGREYCPRPYYGPSYYRCPRPGPPPPRPYFRPRRPDWCWNWRSPRIYVGWGPFNVCWR